MIGWKILPVAQAELEEAIEYYFDIDPKLAVDFYRHFSRHLQLIREHPYLHQLRRFAVRYSHLTPQFHEYYIAYIVEAGEVMILAIGHSKRKPRPWRQRPRGRLKPESKPAHPSNPRNLELSP